MHKADPVVSAGNGGIAGAEADGLLDKLYRLVSRAAGQKLAPAEVDKRADRVAIDRKHHLELANGVLASALRLEQHALGLVCEWVLGGYCQGLVDQRFGAFPIGALRFGRSVQSALHKRGRQSALRFDRPRIERQRTLE